MIPKIIHLCWFSGDDYPVLIEKCIDSWKRILPDFTIKIWDKKMAEATGIPYVIEAIQVNKWAFAADVIRVYALYHEGGIYMDSDILIKRRFDSLMSEKLVLFQEYHYETAKQIHDGHLSEDGTNLCKGKNVPGIGIQAAFMMAEKGQPLLKKILDYYIGRHFIKGKDIYDIDTIAPGVFASIAEEYGYKYIDKKQNLDDIIIYPSTYVAGGLFENVKESFAVHCILHSWKDKTKMERIFKPLKQLILKFLKRDPISMMDKIINEESNNR